MNYISGLATVVSAVATVAIAYLSYTNYRLAKAIEKSNREREARFSDLLQALVISNVTPGESPLSTKIDDFKKYYKGTTKIFD